MPDQYEELDALIREIRTAFNRLKATAEALHADLGVTASMRAVLEALVRDAPRTVPDIAREKSVSRQHVQTVVNALIEAGLVSSRDNPGHKRSPLYQPTAQGKRLFAEIRAREAAPLARLAACLPEAELRDARRLLARLNEGLASTPDNKDGKET